MMPAKPDPAPAKQVLRGWTVSAPSSRAVFILLATGIIPVALMALGRDGLSPVLALLAPAVGLFYMWVLGECQPWVDNWNRRWWQTDRAVLTRDTEGQVDLYLHDVRKMRRPMPWTIVLTRRSGLRVVLPLPRKAARLRQDIRAAVASIAAKSQSEA